jgi:hypothetical protein
LTTETGAPQTRRRTDQRARVAPADGQAITTIAVIRVHPIRDA